MAMLFDMGSKYRLFICMGHYGWFESISAVWWFGLAGTSVPHSNVLGSVAVDSQVWF